MNSALMPAPAARYGIFGSPLRDWAAIDTSTEPAVLAPTTLQARRAGAMRRVADHTTHGTTTVAHMLSPAIKGTQPRTARAGYIRRAGTSSAAHTPRRAAVTGWAGGTSGNGASVPSRTRPASTDSATTVRRGAARTASWIAVASRRIRLHGRTAGIMVSSVWLPFSTAVLVIRVGEPLRAQAARAAPPGARSSGSARSPATSTPLSVSTRSISAADSASVPVLSSRAASRWVVPTVGEF
ncbi:hypothetical protein SHIRM173S_02254 [Streptomyces hirsutus]